MSIDCWLLARPPSNNEMQSRNPVMRLNAMTLPGPVITTPSPTLLPHVTLAVDAYVSLHHSAAAIGGKQHDGVARVTADADVETSVVAVGQHPYIPPGLRR